MKTVSIISIVILFLFSEYLIGQSPAAIPYQAIARNNAGELITSQNISLRISIRDENVSGTILYQETHNVVTNNYGLFTLNIGQGIISTGSFAAIKWGSNEKFLEVELDPSGGNSFTAMGTHQLLSVPYSLHSETSVNILDSLVLRDTTGEVRMVLNPNTGIFKMMNNDTVWYSIQVSSPPTVKQNLEGGYTYEKGSTNGSNSYEILRNPAGGIVTSRTITSQPNGDVSTITRENADDGTPVKITNETYTKETIGSSTFTVKHTTIEEYKGGVLVKKSFSNGYRTTTEYFDEVTGQLKYREEKTPQNAYGDLFVVSVFDSTGTLTARRQENATGQITGYFHIASQKSTIVEPGKITTESPSGKTEVRENTITITVDTTVLQQGIDPVTQDPYMQRADTIGNENYRVTLKYNDIHTNAQRFDIQDNFSRIRLDVTTDYPTLNIDAWDPLEQSYYKSNFGWMYEDYPIFYFLINDSANSSPPTGLAFDPVTDGMLLLFSDMKWFRDTVNPLSSSSFKFDLDNDEPTFSMDWWDPTSTDNYLRFCISPITLDKIYIMSVTDPVTNDSTSIRFIPSSSTIEFRGDVLASNGLTVSGLTSLSSLSTTNGGSLTFGLNSMIVGPSSCSFISGPSSFIVTPTLSTWVGTLSLSSLNSSSVLLLQNSGISLTSGSSVFSVTPTATHVTSTLSVNSGSFLVTPTIGSWAGTLSLSSLNSSSLLSLTNSNLSLTAGSSILTVSPTLSTFSGALSVTSPSLSSVFVVDNSSVSLTSGSSVFSVTPTASTVTGTLSVNSGAFMVTPTTGSWAGTLSLSSLNSSSLLSLSNSALSLTAGSSIFTVSPTLSTFSGALSVSSPSLSSVFSVDNSSVSLTSGSSVFSVTPTASTVTGTLSVNSGAFMVTPTTGSWAGTLSLSSLNSSSLLSLSNSALSLTAGSSVFTVSPTLSTFSGALSVSSPSLSSVFVVDNSSVSLTSGSSVFSVTPTVSSMTGTLSVTGSLSAYGSLSVTHGSSFLDVGASDITLTNGSNSLVVSSGALSLSGAVLSSGALTVTSPLGISIPSGGLSVSNLVTAGSFSGNGSFITGIDAGNITTGTLSDARLSSNVPKLNQFNNFTAPIFVAATPGQDAITGIAFGQTPGPPANLAGKFYGNVNITGNLTKGSGTFKIDHPLDPLNKYLYHSFVESPDMMNIYTGTISLNEDGKATVDLPEWFESLNKDFHYQLTCVGGYAQVFISKEIEENKFEIAGGKENMKVSWQVTGTRKDAYAEKYRVQVEEEKPAGEKGTYLHPDAFVNE